MNSEHFSFSKVDKVPLFPRRGLYDEVVSAFIEQQDKVVIVNVKEPRGAENISQGIRVAIERRGLSDEIRCSLRSGKVYLEKLEP